MGKEILGFIGVESGREVSKQGEGERGREGVRRWVSMRIELVKQCFLYEIGSYMYFVLC